jgi:hypothetical protein
MATSTSTPPVAGAQVARAMTYLVYAFVVVAMVLLLLFLQAFSHLALVEAAARLILAECLEEVAG